MCDWNRTNSPQSLLASSVQRNHKRHWTGLQTFFIHQCGYHNQELHFKLFCVVVRDHWVGYMDQL